MNLFRFFLTMAIFCALVSVVMIMIIISELQKRQVKINFFLLKLYIPKYIGQYKELTLAETGKVGKWYYPCIISINLAWILAVIGFICKGCMTAL